MRGHAVAMYCSRSKLSCRCHTGTLTENAMTVQRIVAGGRTWAVSGSGYTPDGAIAYTTSP